MKSRYNVVLYFNPILNDRHASLMQRMVYSYQNSSLSLTEGNYGLASTNFETALFIFETNGCKLPLIEHRWSCFPAISKLERGKQREGKTAAKEIQKI